MATKKAVKKAAPAGTKALAKWDERLAALAGIATRTEESTGGGGQFIGTRAGQLTFNNAAIPGNKMNVVVIDHVLENQFFDSEFDADNPRSPICYAFGRDAGDMAPHEASADKQADTCAACPHNEFGSAAKGRGKACKNIRRLALITEDQLDDIASATPVYIKVPVMSGKVWAGYVKQLASTLNRPPLGVITELSLVPDPKSQFKMQFRLVNEIEDGDVIEGLLNLNERVAKEIEFPYQAPGDDEEEKPQKRGGGKAVKKQAGKAPPARGRQAPAKAAPSGPQRATKAAPARGGKAAAPAAAPARGKAGKAPQDAPPRGRKY